MVSLAHRPAAHTVSSFKMVSLRFPFSFSQHPNGRPPRATSGPFTVVSASIAAGAVAGVVAPAGLGWRLTSSSEKPRSPSVQNAPDFLFSSNRSSPLWGSISFADGSAKAVESRTGFSFPAVIGDSRRLLGVGLRKKSLFGLKNIDVYAFGVYADSESVKKLLSDKYGNLSVSEIKEKKLNNDLMEADIPMTVRLQIVYGRLSIRSVRSAFEESVGSRLLKFGGADNKELLQSFTSLFKDEYKIPRGSVIELSREQDNVLRTSIDGKEVGSIQSKLLCRSILDLYIGDQPFDRQAREDVEANATSLLEN